MKEKNVLKITLQQGKQKYRLEVDENIEEVGRHLIQKCHVKDFKKYP